MSSDEIFIGLILVLQLWSICTKLDGLGAHLKDVKKALGEKKE